MVFTSARKLEICYELGTRAFLGWLNLDRGGERSIDYRKRKLSLASALSKSSVTPHPTISLYPSWNDNVKILGPTNC